MGNAPEPARIGAVARTLVGRFAQRLALDADAIASILAQEHRMVAWDREQLIGQVQQRLYSLGERRVRKFGGDPVRVVERTTQPLESLEVVWQYLLQGRRVALDLERGACSAVAQLLQSVGVDFVRALGCEVLFVDAKPDAADGPHSWPLVAPDAPGPRVAVIEALADRELAAYVLARVALRRTGTDPRAVKQAYVVGSDIKLERHLKRLWMGTAIGPANVADSFAGPVTSSVREAYVTALAAWTRAEHVHVLSLGGDLERAEGAGHYLAPTLLRTAWPVPELPLAGPMLVLVECDAQQAAAGAEAATRDNGQVVVIGAVSERYGGDVRYIRGALLVERLPPGLPDPRPA